MIILLSPSKKQAEILISNTVASTNPLEIEKANFLMTELQKIPIDELSKKMKISSALAKSTYGTIKKFSTKNKGNLLQAIHLFEGEAFQKLDSKSLLKNDLLFAQNHLIILSALYGYLRPFDAVQNYRLDMNNAIKIYDSMNLYDYWKETITHGINNLLLAHKNKIILNLSSSEYFKTIHLKKLSCKVINVDFLVYKNSVYKTIGIYAKRGRGSLARYIINKKIDSPEEIIGFNDDGFEYSHSQSTPERYVFVLNLK
ncbi:MAG: YaaA family protein [Coxiellaceae bacterium]|nr:YaaA family protein [Coxiellaceae bacterium]